MTLVVTWQEDGHLWMAADTRIAAGSIRKTDSGSKLFGIRMLCHRPDADGMPRVEHYFTTYGFAFSGAVLPAVMTAATAGTLFQDLISTINSAMPPRFEEVAEAIRKLASRFLREHYDAQRREESLFFVAFAGWCPYEDRYKVAHLVPSIEEGVASMSLSYCQTQPDGTPWLVLGSRKLDYDFTLRGIQEAGDCHGRTTRLPKIALEEMILKDRDDVGGAISIGIIGKPFGFRAYPLVQPVETGKPKARRAYNGIDLDDEVGVIGHYAVGSIMIA